MKLGDSLPESGPLCGCGKPTHYSHSGGRLSCNKYYVCPTYDELRARHNSAVALLRAYQAKREVDGLNGRKWHAAKHFEAEAMIERLTEKVSTPTY